MKNSIVLALFITFGFAFAGYAIADEGKDESGKGKRSMQEYREDGRDHSYFQRHGYNRLDIPKGHYPPPGECRVWFPDRPAGQQSPPGNCDQLRRRVPAGAWLIQHPGDDLNHVQVVVFDEHRPGNISVVGEFEIGSGNFVRVVFDQ